MERSPESDDAAASSSRRSSSSYFGSPSSTDQSWRIARRFPPASSCSSNYPRESDSGWHSTGYAPLTAIKVPLPGQRLALLSLLAVLPPTLQSPVFPCPCPEGAEFLSSPITEHQANAYYILNVFQNFAHDVTRPRIPASTKERKEFCVAPKVSS